MLQRNSKLVTLGNIGMPAHTHLKDSIILKKASMFISRQKINFILHVFLDTLQRYCKTLALDTLGMPGYIHPKWYSHLLCLSAGRKLTPPPMLFWRYYKDIQTYFGYFGLAWLDSPKMIVPTCRRLQCLSACKK